MFLFGGKADMYSIFFKIKCKIYKVSLYSFFFGLTIQMDNNTEQEKASFEGMSHPLEQSLLINKELID